MSTQMRAASATGRWGCFILIGLPLAGLVGLMLLSSGKHPELLIESPYTYAVVAGAFGSIVLALLISRLAQSRIDFVGSLVALSLTLACIGIGLLFLKRSELREPFGDVLSLLVLFYALTGICGGVVLTTLHRSGKWLLVSVFSAALLVIGIVAALSNAKHWGNF